MGRETSIGGVVLALLIVGGLIGWRFYNKGESGNDILDQIKLVVAECPSYEKNKDYFDYITEKAHEEAFDRAYTMGGRRRAATFDEGKYLIEVFAVMIDLANADKATAVATELAVLRKEYVDTGGSGAGRR